MSGGKVLGADARSSLYPGERRSARGPSGFGTTVRRRRGAADVSGDSSRRDSCDAFLTNPGSSAPLAPRSPHQLLGGVRGVVGGVRGVVGGVSENVVRYAVNAQPRPHRLEVRRHQAATPPPRRHAATGDKYAALSPTGARVMHDGLLAPPPGPNSPALRRARRSSSPRQTTAPRPRVRSGCRGVRLRRGPRRPSGQRRTRAVDQLYSFSKRSSSSSREWYFVSGTNLM